MLFFSLQPLDQQESEAESEVLFAMEICHVEERIGDHCCEIFDGLSHRFGAEDDPADDCEEKGQCELQRFLDVGQESPMSHHILMLRIDAQQIVDGQQGGVEEAPADKRPVSPMP